MYDLIINYGADVFKTAYETLEKSDLRERFTKNSRAVIKPNLVLAKHPRFGATTHAEIIDAILAFLTENGVSDIKIAESAWVGADTKQAYAVCGYERLTKKYGVRLVDLKGAKTKVLGDGSPIEVFSEALDCDLFINAPVLKAHCQTRLTCCLKNLKGIIPDSEKRRFHTKGLHEPIARLSAAVAQNVGQMFCVVDAICGDISFEEGGNPLRRDMLIAGADPVLTDAYCAGLLGLAPEQVEYITLASKYKAGLLYDEKTAKILVLNEDKKPRHEKIESDAVRKAAVFVNEKSACSACYSALICALLKTGNNKLSGIKIGQGYKNQTGGGIGIGNCCAGISRHILGCPPKAYDIGAFLKESGG